MTLLGEMTIDGVVEMAGCVAYVPQDAWVFSGTIRDNILFGKPMNEPAYTKATSVCALDRVGHFHSAKIFLL